MRCSNINYLLAHIGPSYSQHLSWHRQGLPPVNQLSKARAKLKPALQPLTPQTQHFFPPALLSPTLQPAPVHLHEAPAQVALQHHSQAQAQKAGQGGQ